MAHDNDPINFEEVARLQNLDQRIDQRLQGNPQALPDDQDALDPKLLQDLHDFYQPYGQAFQSGLDRAWSRLEQRGAAATPQRQSQDGPLAQPGLLQERIHPMPAPAPNSPRWTSRASILIASVLLVVLVSALTLGLILVRQNGSNTGSAPQDQTTPTSATSAASFTVTSVDLAVTPASIDGTTCGNSASFTYTATFHMPSGTPGGTIQFEYTVNNGRSSSTGSVNVSPGQTTQTYTFSSSGTLALDHTYPSIAEVMVTSPNAVNSPQVKPDGACSPAAFKVTSVDMAVSPTSIAGRACGSQTTVTYTATFHIAPNGPGGTIRFEYTVNNGRGSTSASISVSAGQTSATYQFTWSGKLPADHTYPEPGGVIVDSPNQINSTLVAPTGACS